MQSDESGDERESEDRASARARADLARGESPEEPEDLPVPTELLRTLLEEKSLWPLLTVFLGSIGAIGAALLVLSFKDRNVFAAAALLLLLAMTVDGLVRSYRPGGNRAIGTALLLVWASATGLALVAVWTGIA